MGKKTKRALRRQCLVVDDVEMASNNDLNEAKSIHDDDEETAAPECPYLTNVVSVLVGSSAKEFKVHIGVLSKSAALKSQCEALYKWDRLSLREVNPSIFELALCYLYGGEYCKYVSPANPIPKKGDTKATAFHQHSLLYCFARKYQLDQLTTLTIKNIKSLGRLGYHSVFSSAKETYKQLPDDESWFRDCFKQETKKALMKSHELVHESWILETFKEENGNFALDLFTALTGTYEKIISTGIGASAGRESSRKLSRWFSPNLSHATGASTAGSSSVEWTEGDSASERDSISDETDGSEAISVSRSCYVEEPTPSEESPCVVEAVPEVEPRSIDGVAAVTETSHANEAVIYVGEPCHETEPPQEVIELCTETEPPEKVIVTTAAGGIVDLDWGWRAGSFAKARKGKKDRRGRHHFSWEEAPAEVSASALEEPLAVEEPPAVEEPAGAEEPAAAEEEPAAVDEPVAAEELAEFEVPVEYEEEPTPRIEVIMETVPEPMLEPEPVSAAEDAPADLQPEPLWGFSLKKSKKRAKKNAWLTPPIPFSPPSPVDAQVIPAESNILAPDTRLVDPADASVSERRYASLPVFKYLTLAEEPQPDETPCTGRGYHLARDTRWMECRKCRAELSALAREMARASNPGWVFT